MGRHFARFRGVLDAVILCAILAPVGAALGASASLNTSNSFFHLTHNPGGPGGATFQLLNQPLQATSTPSNTYNSPISFEPGGNTVGKGGVGRTQSSTIGKVVFPSGAGVTQTDPVASPSQSASAMRLDFKAAFDITGAGTFGPTINGTFSIPFGATVGAGGFALLECEVIWEKIVNGGAATSVRAPFIVNSGSSPSGLFSTPGTYLTSFNATSALNTASMTNTAGKDQLIVRGFVQFASNNDEEPTHNGFPEQGTGFGFYQPSNQAEADILRMVPEMGFEEVFQGPTVYWDTNGSTPGAGSTPSGPWNGSAPAFSNDPTGSSPTSGAVPSDAAVVFHAGSGQPGATYTVQVTGTQQAAQVVVEDGNVSFNSGTLQVGTFNVADGLTATVGSVVAGSDGLVKQGAGTVNLLAPTNTYTGDTNVDAGTLIIKGIKGGGELTVSEGAKAVVPAVFDQYDPSLDIFPAGTDLMGSKVNALRIDPGGQLDLGNNDMAVDHDGTESPLEYVASLIRSGYNNGAWDGTGIVSSTAVMTDNTVFALGYAENGQLPDQYNDTTNLFYGIPVDGTTVLVKFTWVGDLNLDGFVNFSDVVEFNGSFDDGATGGRHWFEGDFDYDGFVGFSDLVLFNGAYDEDKPSLPEPAGLAAACAGALALLARRRRNRV